ncbi:NAD(P)-dependent oxidoreductase [Aliisedimentitalea scapharcae]|uniref:NAD(P)-dependent oxidoreductase n=1 Tax=Aliisedimentitalea scapharcae TaxID=1524259 RepID=A0ABZ2XUW1_9RHOB
MQPIDLVCLCRKYDLKDFFEAGLRTYAPWITMRFPDEVVDPQTIRHAVAFTPDPSDFAPYPNLAMVSSAGAGVDAILSAPSLKPETTVSRVIVDEQAQMIGGFAIWHIVNWQRQMQGYVDQQAQQQWAVINRTAPSRFPVGILGFGKIGSCLARALRGLGYPVTAYASRDRQEPDGTVVVSGSGGLAQTVSQSRAVVNLLPLTDETVGILNTRLLDQMRDDAILINLGRGAHLAEPDLIPALERGRPAMAALDTVATEPLPQNHPFWTHDRIRITPHVAGDADPMAVARFIADGIASFEAGQKPAGLVDRQTGY